MIKRLRLHDFKIFADTTVAFGPFTVLIGANASGKSNVRDALRFLHGLGLGYTLAETIDEPLGGLGDLRDDHPEAFKVVLEELLLSPELLDPHIYHGGGRGANRCLRLGTLAFAGRDLSAPLSGRARRASHARSWCLHSVF